MGHGHLLARHILHEHHSAHVGGGGVVLEGDFGDGDVVFDLHGFARLELDVVDGLLDVGVHDLEPSLMDSYILGLEFYEGGEALLQVKTERAELLGEVFAVGERVFLERSLGNRIRLVVGLEAIGDVLACFLLETSQVLQIRPPARAGAGRVVIGLGAPIDATFIVGVAAPAESQLE